MINRATINNRYRLIRQLGSGAVGEVFLVEDMLRDNKKVALKTIKDSLISNNMLQTFKKEFEVMTRLKHPNLVRVYDFGLDRSSGTYYITMEYVAGQTLRQLIIAQNKLALGNKLEIMVSLLQAIEFIHSRNILHRDIKPANVMLSLQDNNPDTYHLQLMDFGLADLEQADRATSRGTLLYMAPEVIQQSIDHRVDLYATGITFYELITGDVPFRERDSGSIVRTLRDRTLFLQQRTYALERLEDNPALKDIFGMMLAYDPDERYSSCSQIIFDLNQKLGHSFSLETHETREAYVLGAGFVGREKEFSRLTNWLENTEHKVLLVHGEAGIGKSRLFQEFKYYCQMQNITILEEACSEQIQEPFGPFLQILNEILLCAERELIVKFGSELKKLLPDHVCFEGIKANPAYDPKTERSILIQNVCNFFIEWIEVQDSQIILCVHDLHWSDEASISTLEELMYKLQAGPKFEGTVKTTISGATPFPRGKGVRIYASCREQGVPKLNKLKAQNRLVELHLKPFNKSNVQSYIEAIFGQGKIDGSLFETIPIINEKVGGNPFFLQELVKAMVDRGLITRETQAWTLVHPVDKVDLPTNLKSLLRSRLDSLRCSPAEWRTVKVLVLLNRAITFAELQQMVPVDRDFLTDLERIELLKIAIYDGELTYRCAHALIGETIEESIPDNEQETLHRLIAEKLEEIHSTNLDNYITELAYHYSRTDNRGKAIEYLDKAGDKAKANYQNKEALEFYDQVLSKLIEDELDKRTHVLIKKGSILNHIGKWDKSEKVYREARQIVAKTSSIKWNIRINQGLAVLFLGKGEYDRVMECYQESLSICKELGDKQGIVVSLYGMGAVYTYIGPSSKALELYEQSLQLCEELDDQKHSIRILNNIGIIYSKKGDYQAALDRYHKALKILEEAGDKLLFANVVGNLGTAYYRMRDFKEALSYFKQSQKILEELGDKQGLCSTIGNLGNAYYSQGYTAEAIDCFKKFLRLSEELGYKEGISNASGSLGMVYAAQANYNRAGISPSRQLKYRPEPVVPNRSVPIVAGTRGQLDPVQTDFTTAILCFDRAITTDREIGLNHNLPDWLVRKAEILYTLKQIDQAWALNTEGKQLAEEVGRKDCIFKSKVLSAKIKWARGQWDTATQDLHNLLNVTEQNSDRAVLHHELWRMTQLKQGQEEIAYEHRQTALDYYNKTDENNIENKTRIAELEQDVLEQPKREKRPDERPYWIEDSY